MHDQRHSHAQARRVHMTTCCEAVRFDEQENAVKNEGDQENIDCRQNETGPKRRKENHALWVRRFQTDNA